MLTEKALVKKEKDNSMFICLNLNKMFRIKQKVQKKHIYTFNDYIKYKT